MAAPGTGRPSAQTALNSSADALRRLGYRLRGSQPSAIARLLDRAGYRPVPLLRACPTRGHHYASCPLCGLWYGLLVEPDWRSLTFSCGCVRGEIGAEELALLLAGGQA
jgi:hypothetical protein